MKKEVKIERLEIDETLLIEEKLINKDTLYYKEFNELYNECLRINKNETLTKEEELDLVNKAKQAAKIIAIDFDFEKEELKSLKKNYVKFARDVLYIAGSKPVNDPEAVIYLIRALYGQTNIAYNMSGEHKIVNIEDGNEWVDYIERHTDDRILKAYALTLRAFQYIVNAKELAMAMPSLLKKVESDLLYATKWDEENFLSYLSLGLLYSDTGHSKYDVEKAKDNFNKVLDFKDKETKLEKYLMDDEKNRAMNIAKRKLDSLE